MQTGNLPTAENFSNTAQDVAAGMKDRAFEMKEKYVDPAWVQSRDFVRANPGKAMIFSAALGLLLGTLLRRRP